MDKIVRTSFLFTLLLLSCSRTAPRYSENKNNLKFVIEKYITVDFKKKKLFLNYHNLKYEDTIIFTNSERIDIINFFNKYNLNGETQEFWYIDENSVSTSLHDEIIILEDDKVRARFVINTDHKIDKSYFEEFETKIVKYRNFVKNIVKKKYSYKKANDSLKHFVKRRPALLM
ncbi:hypothetical protein [Flavobacterium sp.]|uniref:hypothetical protein n=1 Tax=Flavobacterium sp. TaxID=239 RepID=UPI00326676B5